jgi:hypothetical protein
MKRTKVSKIQVTKITYLLVRTVNECTGFYKIRKENIKVDMYIHSIYCHVYGGTRDENNGF